MMCPHHRRGRLFCLYAALLEGSAKRRSARAFILTGLLLQFGDPRAVRGETAAAQETPDRYAFSIHSETYLRWFERALLPGPNGSVVRREPFVPAYEYLSLEVRDLDLGSSKDSVDIELAGFSRVFLVRPEGEALSEGDVAVANARYHQDDRYIRIGRQQGFGGAARYVRFDGASAGLDFGETAVDAYAGFTVLPHWDEHPAYYYLGAVDSLARDSEPLNDPNRGGHRLAGVRASYQPSHELRAALSFHEQIEAEQLAQRRLAGELWWAVSKRIDASGSAMLDLPGVRLAETRIFADWRIAPEYTASVDYVHTVPALFLSHQSVLSVFSTEGYDEVGGAFNVHPSRIFSAEASSYVQRYSTDTVGFRSELRARFVPDRSERLTWQSVYGRLVGFGTGYHSLRNSLRYLAISPLTLTADVTLYVYDEAISGRRTSSVYALNVEWSKYGEFEPGFRTRETQQSWRVLWGASLVQSPVASADLQTLLRFIYSLEGGQYR